MCSLDTFQERTPCIIKSSFSVFYMLESREREQGNEGADFNFSSNPLLLVTVFNHISNSASVPA